MEQFENAIIDDIIDKLRRLKSFGSSPDDIRDAVEMARQCIARLEEIANNKERATWLK